MEERVPNESGDQSDEPPLPTRSPPSGCDLIPKPRPFPSRKKSVKLPSPEAIESETYIIQIPKDQIFSTPSPETAIIAERHRLPQKKERPWCNRWLCIIVALILLALVIGIIVWTFHILFTPKAPLFTVVNVIVKNPPFTHKKTHPGYQITLETENPNGRLSISYGNKGDATLLYKNHKIGTGKFPEVDQDAGSSESIELALTGSNGPLPDDVETRVQDKKGKKHVSLSIEMDVPITMKGLGGVKLGSKEINVVCAFKVSSLGAGKEVVSQKCQSKFK
ncbi:LATE EMBRYOGENESIS ABUNDANT (LEA) HYDROXYPROLINE-RICH GLYCOPROTEIN FAMILY [Salix viminalis]|uniref:LATE EMBRYOGENESIS ABUNDANT (LEA) HYDROXYPROLINE-RICH GLYCOPROTEIN FAMILY n=1 Tax=Salix viminalis TaxID=40686 RepID=A0A6N2MDU7_SALVM|nr:LATE EMBRYOGENESIS ABUNDANT (LEA) HYDROXYPROLINE-RICH GLYCOPROTEIN FAMILY [Salix viminalis]